MSRSMKKRRKPTFDVTPRQWAALCEKQRLENARQADFIAKLLAVAERLGHVSQFLLLQIDPLHRDMALAEAQASAEGKLIALPRHEC